MENGLRDREARLRGREHPAGLPERDAAIRLPADAGREAEQVKEITFPVLVLDDNCRMCEELDIVSDTRTRMYAEGECVNQDTLVRCSNVYKCMRIQERLKKRGENG
jgi:hypothetical protein